VRDQRASERSAPGIGQRPSTIRMFEMPCSSILAELLEHRRRVHGDDFSPQREGIA
jgi:hypothetical protein